MFSLPFGQGLCFVNVFLAVFICVCLSVKKRATGKNVFFAAEEPIFSPTVLRFERFGHSANESLTSSAFRPCGYSHCLFMSVSVCSCCLCAALMKLRLLLVFFVLLLLLLLMLSHFLWAPDKPTKQGENRALYWDACQDSPWIYGQQTVFITQPREAE